MTPWAWTQVLFIPAGEPPHKPGQAITSGDERLAMIQLAIAGNPAFAVSRMELDRDGPSYTVDTLTALRAERLAAGASPDIVFIVSAEGVRGVRDLARSAARPRAGDHRGRAPRRLPRCHARRRRPRRFREHAERVVFLDGPRLRLSASDLRERAAAGRSLRYLVPDAVAAHIEDHGLYRDPRRTP